MLTGPLVPVAAMLELTESRVIERIILEARGAGDCLDLFETSLGTLALGHRDRPVEGDDRRLPQDHQRIVQADDLFPVRLFGTRRVRVNRRDRGLDVILGDLGPGRGLVQQTQPFFDEPQIPPRSILIEERAEVSRGIDPRRQSRRMKVLRRWTVRVIDLFGRSRRERELADEIESHLQLNTDDHIRRGMTPADARRQAVLDLGSAEALKEEYRDQRGVPFADHALQDLKYAGRALRRDPGFTALAVLTIAFGVAGPVVMFTMAKAWILDPLPFTNPDALVDLRRLQMPSGAVSGLNRADFLDIKRTTQTVRELAGYGESEVRLTGGDRAERLRSGVVGADFFDVIGVRAGRGRVFRSGEDREGAPCVTVISDVLWRDRFQGDPAIEGRTLRLDDRDCTVVGVMADNGAASGWPLVDISRLNRHREYAGLGVERRRIEYESDHDRRGSSNHVSPPAIAPPLSRLRGSERHDNRHIPIWLLSDGFDGLWAAKRAEIGADRVAAKGGAKSPPVRASWEGVQG